MKKLHLMLACAAIMATGASAQATSKPVITIEPMGNHNIFTPSNLYTEICVFDYIVTATGEGDLHLYLNGVEVSNPCIIPQDYTDWHDDTWYEQEEYFCFAASIKTEEGNYISADTMFIVPAIPQFNLTYDEETESVWMSFQPYSARYRCWNISSQWLESGEPFKVWEAPQPIYKDVRVEVMANTWSVSSNMGIAHDLSPHIVGFNIFRYSTYEDGVYYPYEYAYDFTPETPFVTQYNSICNKYWQPSDHQACYSGNVVIPNHVEYILDHTFDGCSELRSVTIPASVTTINEQAFKGCTGLDTVLIESLSSWCNVLFSDSLSCPLFYAEHLIVNGEEINDLVIDNSEGFWIGQYAFAGYKGLASVTILTTDPPSAAENAFYNLYDKTTLFVPNEALDAYQSHEEWGRFSHIIPFIGVGPGDVNGDGSVAISDVTNLIDLLLSGDGLPAWADVNGDCIVNISDVTALIDMLLNGGGN